MVFELKKTDYQKMEEILSQFPASNPKHREISFYHKQGAPFFLSQYILLSGIREEKVDFYYGDVDDDLFSTANNHVIDISGFSFGDRYAMIILKSRDSVIMCTAPYESEFWRLSGLGCVKDYPYTPIKGASKTLEFTDISYKRLSTWLRYPELLNLLRTGPFGPSSDFKKVMDVHFEYLTTK